MEPLGDILPVMRTGCIPTLLAMLLLIPAPVAGQDNWVDLFDGATLAGWHTVNGADSTFTVRNGMIVCSGKPICMLRSERQYENFILEIEWRHLAAKGNAGIFVWSDPLTARGQPFTRGIEVQVLDGRNTPNYTSHGDVFSVHGATLTPDRPHPGGWQRCLPSEQRSNDSPAWNHYRITCLNGSVTLAVNGKEVSGGSECSPRRGYICLESEGSEVHFRNLRIRELPPAPGGLSDADAVPVDMTGFYPLYNGVDLSGWQVDEVHEGHWSAADWKLDYDGKGDTLWTKDAYGDFELIADWRWSGPAQSAFLPVIRPDGRNEVDADGKQVTREVHEAGDSGIYLRGSSKSQINIWCWPIGSGEVYGYRTDGSMDPSVRAGVTPLVNADQPIGSWNRFHITMVGERLSVVLNGQLVIDRARLPGVKPEGRIALQHHGFPIQFANLYLRELPNKGQ